MLATARQQALEAIAAVCQELIECFLLGTLAVVQGSHQCGQVLHHGLALLQQGIVPGQMGSHFHAQGFDQLRCGTGSLRGSGDHFGQGGLQGASQLRELTRGGGLQVFQPIRRRALEGFQARGCTALKRVQLLLRRRVPALLQGPRLGQLCLQGVHQCLTAIRHGPLPALFGGLLRGHLFALLFQQLLIQRAQGLVPDHGGLDQLFSRTRQGLLHRGHQRAIAHLLLLQPLLPARRHHLAALPQRRVHRLQTCQGTVVQFAVSLLQVLLQGGKQFRHQRFDGFTRLAATLGKAALQGPGDIPAEGTELGLQLLLEGVLPGQELLLQEPTATVQLLPHCAQALTEGRQLGDQGGQGLGLLLQGAVGALALVRQGLLAELAIAQAVQLAAGRQPLAAAKGGNKTQHGRGRDPRHRRPEGHAQALDGRCQTGANGTQFRAALQGTHRTAEGLDHADKGAHQAQHDQQSHQVGCQDRHRQTAALADQALLHRLAQGLGQLFQPALLIAPGSLQHGTAQRARRALIGPELGAPRRVSQGNQQHHHGCQQVSRGDCPGHPENHRDAYGESQQGKQSGHGASSFTDSRASSMPCSGCRRRLTSATSTRCISR